MYLISDTGCIRSIDRYILVNGGMRFQKGKKLKTRIDKDGYEVVSIYIDGKCKNCFMHRLVAEAFIPNPDNLPQVNHKDENKQNNHVENLEWCTVSYNINYGRRNEKMTEKLKHYNNKPVVQYTLTDEIKSEFYSVNEAARQTGLKETNISACCRGQYGYRTCGGFKWSFKNE